MWERALGCLTLDCPGHGFLYSASKGLRVLQPWLKGGKDMLPAETGHVINFPMLALQAGRGQEGKVHTGSTKT